MARVFDISSTSDGVHLDAGGHGQVVLTATNVSGRPLRGRFLVKPIDALAPGAFAIDGNAERNFNPNDTQQVAVSVNLPAGTKAGKYRFRLDGVNIDNPDEDFTEGPALALEVKETAPPARRMPWWIYAVIVLVLAVGGAVAYLFLRPAEVEVPELTHLPVKSAADKLAALGLAVSQISANSTEPEGLVILQAPLAGQKVKKKDTVSLTVASGAVELPKLTDRLFKDASDQLSALGLVAVQVPKETGSAQPGQVIGQDPAPGQAARKGSQVKLTVAAATAPTPPPPPPAPPPNPYVGAWVNQNPAAAVISRLTVADTGGRITVQTFAKGPPETDLGTALAAPLDNQLMAAIVSPAASGSMMLSRQGDVLIASIDLQKPNQPRTHVNETFRLRFFRPRDFKVIEGIRPIVKPN